MRIESEGCTGIPLHPAQLMDCHMVVFACSFIIPNSLSHVASPTLLGTFWGKSLAYKSQFSYFTARHIFWSEDVGY